MRDLDSTGDDESAGPSRRAGAAAWLRSVLAISAALVLVAVGFSESRLVDVDVVLVAPAWLRAGRPQALRTLVLTDLDATDGARVVPAATEVEVTAGSAVVARARLRPGPDGSATGRVLLPASTRGPVVLRVRAPSAGPDATVEVPARVALRARLPSPITRPSQPAQARAAVAGSARVLAAVEGGALVPPLRARLFLCASGGAGRVTLSASPGLRLEGTEVTLAPARAAALGAELEGVDAVLGVRTATGATASLRLPVAIAALLPDVQGGALRVRSFRARPSLTLDAWTADGWTDAWSVRAGTRESRVSLARLGGAAGRVQVRAAPTLLAADAADALVGERASIAAALRPVPAEVERCADGSHDETAERLRDASALAGVLPLPPATHGADARRASLERSKRVVRLGAVAGLLLLGLAVAGLVARAAWTAEREAGALLEAAGAERSAAASGPRAEVRRLVELGAYVATAAFGFLALALVVWLFA